MKNVLLFFFCSCMFNNIHGVNYSNYTERGSLIRHDTTVVDTITEGTFIDKRDGKTYGWVRIGKQVWMTRNLAYRANEGCYAYKNRYKRAEREGYLYTWDAAQKAAPEGWHLPSKEEYDEMVEFLGGSADTPRISYEVLTSPASKLNFKKNGQYWADRKKFVEGIYPFKSMTLWTSTYGLSFHKDTLYTEFGIDYITKEAGRKFRSDKNDALQIRCVRNE